MDKVEFKGLPDEPIDTFHLVCSDGVVSFPVYDMTVFEPDDPEQRLVILVVTNPMNPVPKFWVISYDPDDINDFALIPTEEMGLN